MSTILELNKNFAKVKTKLIFVLNLKFNSSIRAWTTLVEGLTVMLKYILWVIH